MVKEVEAIRERISRNWYVDDQFAQQLGSPLQASVVQGRWEVFDAELHAYLAETPRASLKILDAGCGDGINLVGLQRILNEIGLPHELFAVDINPVRIERASGRVSEARVLLASVTCLPFEEGSYDVVLCNHVIEHLPAPEETLREIFRVVRPGGLVIIGVPNEGCFMARLRNHLLQRSILRTTDHVNFYTRDSLSALLMKAGLPSARIHARGWFLPHLHLTGLVGRFWAGRALLNLLSRAMPSQAAELIALAVRKS